MKQMTTNTELEDLYQKHGENRIISLDLLLFYSALAITINHLNWAPIIKTPTLLFRTMLSPAMSVFITITSFSFAKMYSQMEEKNWYSVKNIIHLSASFMPTALLFIFFKLIIDLSTGNFSPVLFVDGLLGKGFLSSGGYLIAILIQLITIFPFYYFFLKSSAFFSITFFILLNILYELIPYTITESGSLYIFFFLRLSLSMLLGILLYMHENRISHSIIPFLCVSLWFYFQALTEVGYQYRIFVRLKHNSQIFNAFFSFGIVFFVTKLDLTLRKFLFHKKKLSDIISMLGQAFIHIYFAQYFFAVFLYTKLRSHTSFLLNIYALPFLSVFLIECCTAVVFSVSAGVIWFNVEKLLFKKISASSIITHVIDADRNII